MLKSVEFINCRIWFVKLSFNILRYNYLGLSIISINSEVEVPGSKNIREIT